MNGTDRDRSLEMIREALIWALEYHVKQGEMNAAQHCNTKVFYSPLVAQLQGALEKTDRLISEES